MPEMEIFDLSMVETCSKLAGEGILERPMHYNFCLGQGNASALSATPQNLGYMKSLMEPGSHWGLNHDQMPGFSMLACALTRGRQCGQSWILRQFLLCARQAGENKCHSD